MSKKKDSTLLLLLAIGGGGYLLSKMFSSPAAAGKPYSPPVVGGATTMPVTQQPYSAPDFGTSGSWQYSEYTKSPMEQALANSNQDQAVESYKSFRRGGTSASDAENMVRQLYPDFRKEMASGFEAVFNTE